MVPERSFSPELAENLPDYVPLSHDNIFLTAPVFDPEEFLLSRARTTLPELRTELRDYLLTLKEELVQLINNDYEAFISLSTDLRSEGAKLKSLRGPLGRLQSTILVCQISWLHLAHKRFQESRTELQLIQDNVQEKLDKRSALREEKVPEPILAPFLWGSSLIDLGPFAIASQDIRISDTLGIPALDCVSRPRR